MANAVIDVGCARYSETESSIEWLLTEYRPSVLLGYDPAWPTTETRWYDPRSGTDVIIHRAAVYTYDGTIGFTLDGLRGRIDPAARALTACVDLNHLVIDSPFPLVLKLDCEGAEYDLLDHLLDHDLDQLVTELLVEWHCLTCGTGGGSHRDDCTGDPAGEAWRQTILDRLRCPVKAWDR